MKLPEQEIINRLKRMPGWEWKENRLQRRFRCRDFAGAVNFVNNVAERAEIMDHHPDILLHDYNYVTIFLSTHRVNGITEDDFVLAHEIEQLHNHSQIEEEE